MIMKEIQDSDLLKSPGKLNPIGADGKAIHPALLEAFDWLAESLKQVTWGEFKRLTISDFPTNVVRGIKEGDNNSVQCFMSCILLCGLNTLELPIDEMLWYAASTYMFEAMKTAFEEDRLPSLTMNELCVSHLEATLIIANEMKQLTPNQISSINSVVPKGYELPTDEFVRDILSEIQDDATAGLSPDQVQAMYDSINDLADDNDSGLVM